MILQALLLLAVRPKVGTTIAYDLTAGAMATNGPSVKVRVTERFDGVRGDGALDTSRAYSEVHATGPDSAARAMEAISGKHDRYIVGATTEWVPATQNTEMGFPDFPFPTGSVAIGHQWDPGKNLRGVLARFKEVRTIAGHRAAILDFVPKPSRAAEGIDEGNDRLGTDSHWVLDLGDGRPLFARIEMIDERRDRSGVFTIVRRDVPGLVPKL